MDTKYNDHTSKMHVDRLIQADLERIINNNCNAAASFDSERTRHILTDEALRRQWKNIEKWLVSSGNMDKKAFWHYFREKDQDDIDAPIEHLGAYQDAKTSRIYIRTTRVICLVIVHDDGAENGYTVFNAYPFVVPTRCGRTLDVDPLPYIMATQSWKRANNMRRTYWRMCCDHTTDFPVKFNEATSALETPIIEGEAHFGTIACNESIMTINLSDATNAYRAYPSDKNSMLWRAFPDTMRAVDTIYRRHNLGKRDDELIGESKLDLTDVFDLRPLVSTFYQKKTATDDVTSDEPPSNAIVIETEKKQKSKERARKKALAKSRATTVIKKKRQSQKKKVAKPVATESVESPIAHRTTEKQPKNQPVVQNSIFVDCLYTNRIPLINEHNEILLSYGALMGFPRKTIGDPVIIHATDAEVQAVRDWFDTKLDSLPEKPSYASSPDTKAPYRDIFADFPLNDRTFSIPREVWVEMYSTIANNANWQPCVSDEFKTWIDNNVFDTFENKYFPKQILRECADTKPTPVLSDDERVISISEELKNTPDGRAIDESLGFLSPSEYFSLDHIFN